jgi:hypothetical protein
MAQYIMPIAADWFSLAGKIAFDTAAFFRGLRPPAAQASLNRHEQ